MSDPVMSNRDPGPAVSLPVTPQRAVDVVRLHKPTTKRIKHPWRQGLLLNIPACKGCEWAEEDGDHDAHVAAAVLACLELTEEWGWTEAEWPEAPAGWYSSSDQFPADRARESATAAAVKHRGDVFRRLVSGWVRVEEQPQ